MSAYLQTQVHDLKIRVRRLEHLKELDDAKKDGETIKYLKHLKEVQEDEIRRLEEGP